MHGGPFQNVVSGLKYQEFVRVRMGEVGGKIMASPLGRGSGVVSSFMKADGILEIPQGVEGYEAGSEVTVSLLKKREELSCTLVAIGSHDPLLDEVSDLLHASDPSLIMSSTHVGSMGGIMAVSAGETHIAGVHLLNEADGTYNTAFIRKYFPQGGVRLVECVGRTQGLMLQKGNPKNIQGISDLTRAGVRYVNRQKGSGTRILIDYLCRKEGHLTAFTAMTVRSSRTPRSRRRSPPILRMPAWAFTPQPACMIWIFFQSAWSSTIC